jgi:clan AA aspartic protease (TIGR02281 family)
MRGSVPSHLLVLLVGIALGLVLARTVFSGWPATNDADPADQVAVQPGAESRRPRRSGLRIDAVAPVDVLTRDGERVRTRGVLLAIQTSTGPAAGADPLMTSALAVPLEALYLASRADVISLDGQRVPLTRVLAVSSSYQLVLLAPAAATSLPSGLRHAEDGASLHLGLELELFDGARRLPATIDSSARRGAFGEYSYAMRLSDNVFGDIAALLNGADELIGLALRPRIGSDIDANGTMVAFDLQAVSELHYRSGTSEALSGFADKYFRDVPEGRLLAAFNEAEDRNWSAVIAQLTPLANLGTPYGEIAAPLLEAAYREQVLAMTEGRPEDTAEALRMLEDAASLVGWSTERRLLAARILAAAGNVRAALDQTNRGWYEVPPGSPAAESLLQAARRILDTALAGGTLPSVQLIELLGEQLQLDDQHGAYHANLGRLLFEAGRYREALPSLYRARSFDPARYGAEFSAMIERAEARAYTPGLTVVPVYSQGATLFVYGSVPGTPDRFRFILDTGASITAISPRVLDRLRNVRARGSVGLETANGRVEAPLVTITGLDVSGARVNDLDVVVLDSLSGYDGLLGLSFLDNFNMTLDRNRNELTLRLR